MASVLWKKIAIDFQAVCLKVEVKGWVESMQLHLDEEWSWEIESEGSMVPSSIDSQRKEMKDLNPWQLGS